MAFVQPASSPLRVSTFTRAAIDTKRPVATPVATVRMTVTEDKKEPSVVGIQGKSMWKETLYAGGFPGGEAFFLKWISDGMSGDVPDVPQFMQPSGEFKPTTITKTGVLADLDRTEFFDDFIGQSSETNEQDDISDSSPDTASNSSSPDTSSDSSSPDTASSVRLGLVADDDSLPSDVLKTEIPDDTLYGKYFPEARRNIAPEITFRYDKNSSNHEHDRVSMAMLPVVASPTDVYFPKEVKNKAPFIEIFYPNSIATASVRLTLETVDPLPSTAPPPRGEETIVAMLPGSGGGLKLNFNTPQGENIPL